MQTERVTFLTTPDHKAALDAYASRHGKSVGHVVREATSRYIAAPSMADEDEDDEALALALPELEQSIEQMKGTIDAMRATIARTCAAVDLALAGDPA